MIKIRQLFSYPSVYSQWLLKGQFIIAYYCCWYWLCYQTKTATLPSMPNNYDQYWPFASEKAQRCTIFGGLMWKRP